MTHITTNTPQRYIIRATFRDENQPAVYGTAQTESAAIYTVRYIANNYAALKGIYVKDMDTGETAVFNAAGEYIATVPKI